MAMTPKTLSFSGSRLEEMKKGNKVPKKVLEELRSQADKHLDSPVIAVVYRNVKAPSGNPHDYSSLGTYWWPNPDTEDGLPYIRRDGLENPVISKDVKFVTLVEMIRELTLAAYYFEEKKYADKAVRMIYDWFLNPETYMTPHASYAQAIPGMCDGRGIGIIDFQNSYSLFDSVAILEALGWISDDTVSGLKAWYSEFVDWLLTSENGLDEDMQLNNHGIWYDVLVLSSAMFTGRKMLADKICLTAYDRRLKPQVMADGSQPLELARTMGIVYSSYNALSMSVLANIAYANGYKNYWEDDADYGHGLIKSTVDFLYPYIINPESFPYEEINIPAAKYRLSEIMLLIGQRYPGEGYCERAEALMERLSTSLAQPLV